jgi:predicted Zn-dependent peptidase
MMRVLEEDAAPIDRAVGDVPPGLAEILARMMSRSEEGRYSALDEVVDELARLGARLGIRLTRAVARPVL